MTSPSQRLINTPQQVMDDTAFRITRDVDRDVPVNPTDVEQFTIAQAVVHQRKRVADEEARKAVANLFKMFGLGDGS